MGYRMMKWPMFAALLLLAASVLASPAGATPPADRDSARNALQGQSAGALLVDTARTTGAAHFLRAENGVLTREFVGRNAEEAARGFLARYGALLGVNNQAAELAVRNVHTDELGMQHVRFNQKINGVDVFASDLVVHLTADSAVTAANGYVVPAAQVGEAKAELAIESAVEKAVASVKAFDAHVEEANPVYLNTGLITNEPSETYLTYRVKVVSEARPEASQWLFVDANTGEVRFSLPAVHDARNRYTYNLQTATVYSRGVLVRNETSAPVTTASKCTTADINNAHDYAGDTYNFYFNRFGRDSYDNRGAALRSYVCYGRNYANAFWDGTKMTYGAGFAAADDVVGHELTHAVTEYSSNLVYSYQSGALNESFSDIFGEAVDLVNGKGTDTTTVRWDMGENVPGYGAIRDMDNPGRFGDPDSTTSANYYCGTSDSGGVHINSGVPNKAFTLMVDGGTFGGYTVAAIGIDKAVQVQYRANNYYLTSSSKFIDNYNALNSACGDLYGSASAECASVRDAALAVKMNGPICGQ